MKIDNKWKFRPLGEIFNTTSGGTPSRSRKNFYHGDIVWLKSGELSDCQFLEDSEEHITQEAIDNSNAKVFPPDTVLIAMYGATTGRLGILRKPSATNQAVCAILPNQSYMSKVIFYYLLWKRQSLIDQGKGGAQPNINQRIIKQIEFPEIPRREQELIISNLETQFTRLDAVVESLKTIKQKLEVYRKSVLKAAFILDKEEEKIGEYCEVISGATPSTSKKDNWGGDVLWITPKDLSGYRDKYIDQTGRTITKKGYESCSTTLIPPNNVLMSSRAPIGYVVINKKPICTNQGFKSFLIKDKRKLNEEFLYYQLRAQMDEIKKAGSGTTFSEISKLKAENILIKVPMLTTQKEIVSQIESRFSVIDKLEETVDNALLNADRLRKSILKSAFEGKLV